MQRCRVSSIVKEERGRQRDGVVENKGDSVDILRGSPFSLYLVLSIHGSLLLKYCCKTQCICTVYSESELGRGSVGPAGSH